MIVKTLLITATCIICFANRSWAKNEKESQGLNKPALQEIESRHNNERAALHEQFVQKNLTFEKKFASEYELYLEKKGKYPYESAKKINDLNDEREREMEALRQRQHAELTEFYASKDSQGGDSSSGSKNATAGSENPIESAPVVDGTNIPKELNFPGKAKQKVFKKNN